MADRAAELEAKLRETERALRMHENLLAAISDAVFSLDNRFHITTWNPAAERLLGFTAAEVVGRPSAEVIAIENAGDREVRRRELAEGKAVHGESRIRRKDGTWVEMGTSTIPIRDGDRAAGYVCIMRDIAETKQLERQLREHARVVEEANRELDGFTYSVSHDLRAPLRAIDGFSRILLEEFGEMPEDQVRLVNVIRKNTHQMGQLIDDLLQFSRLGRKDIALSSVDMNELLVETLPDVMVGTESRVIDLEIGALPTVVGDRALLKQVWLNLLGNAIKYTRKRERATIAVKSSQVDNELVFEVADNGAGFDMQYVDKLFGVFQRLHRNSEFEGTGVGLALVQRIVRRHGGRVWAEGKEGEGATFRFAFPKRRNGDG